MPLRAYMAYVGYSIIENSIITSIIPFRLPTFEKVKLMWSDED